MKTHALVIACALLSILAIGCNNGPADPIARIESTFDDTVHAACSMCPGGIAGAPNEAECIRQAEDGNPFMGPSFECQRNVYGMYPEQLSPYYNCIADALGRHNSCIRGALATCPPAAGLVEACSTQLTDGINACPLPDSVMAATALSACFSGP